LLFYYVNRCAGLKHKSTSRKTRPRNGRRQKREEELELRDGKNTTTSLKPHGQRKTYGKGPFHGESNDKRNRPKLVEDNDQTGVKKRGKNKKKQGGTNGEGQINCQIPSKPKAKDRPTSTTKHSSQEKKKKRTEELIRKAAKRSMKKQPGKEAKSLQFQDDQAGLTLEEGGGSQMKASGEGKMGETARHPVRARFEVRILGRKQGKLRTKR